MSASSAEFAKLKKRSNVPLAIGGIATASYVIILLYFFTPQFLDLTNKTANEIGDALAGSFAPLAFLWIIVTIWIQKLELSLNTDALREQISASIALVEESEAQNQSQRLDISIRLFENRLKLLSSKAYEFYYLCQLREINDAWIQFNSGNFLSVFDYIELKSREVISGHNLAPSLTARGEWGKFHDRVHEYRMSRKSAIDDLRSIGASDSLIDVFSAGSCYILLENLEMFLESNRSHWESR